MNGTLMAPDEYLWTFDLTFQDASSTFNGTPINNVSFSNSTITGYGSSLAFDSSMNQSIVITEPFLPLFNRSWAFEAWIYLSNMTGWADYTIVGQCAMTWTDECLHLLVRGRKLHLGFFNDDLQGATNLLSSRWYHTAFVFNAVTCNRSLYLDGVLEVTDRAGSTYKGKNGSLTFGAVYWSTIERYFDGLIDQLSYTNRSKTSQDILRDATLTLSFSFNGNSIFDEGPFSINGSVEGSTSFVSGRRNQALQICDVPDSYFTVKGLVLLGRDDQSYSFSIWIKPSVRRRASIIHLSSSADGTDWCLPMIGLTDENQLVATSWSGSTVTVGGPMIPVDAWTHVASTYSPTNGLCLYINGSVYNSSLPFSYKASGTPNYLFVGSPRAAIRFPWWSETTGQYVGAVDELQVYSRELSTADIHELANL